MKFFRSGVMFRALALSLCLMAAPLMAVGFGFSSAHAATPDPAVKLETNYGDIIVRLDARKAPISTANFVQYVKSGFYDGTVFHRVIKSFMIQGGGFTPDLKQKETRAAIRNEADNGLKNKKYTIAMARTGEPHSATAQFFINTVDNPFLDHSEETPQGYGYAVFGQVTEGMDVVDKIEKAKTKDTPHYEDVPVDSILITGCSRFE